MAAPISIPTARLVARVSDVIASHTSRRGFLVRSAIGATALAVAPSTFALRPTTAYAAVCGCSGSECDCGSLCCDGYTEFCCTLTGVNDCPAGTALGGWWKADGASFCGGGPRYYMDCNVVPGSNPCSCGCAGGSCDNRKSCCTRFRYGQCHQEIPVMGAIMCRVVSCTPPWVLDRSCTGDVATDQSTLFHDRPCLQDPTGVVDYVQRVDPTNVRVVGWAIDGDTNQPINVHVYVDGTFALAAAAVAPRPDIGAMFPTYGPNHGYDLTVPVGPTTGSVCVYAINATPPGPNPLLGCRPIDHTAFGQVDQVREVQPGFLRVIGWAIDPDTTAAVDVHLYVDGAFATVVKADDARADVGRAFPSYGANHGYDITIPVSSSVGSLCAYAINSQPPGPNPLLGCRSIDHGPFGQLDDVRRADGSHLRLVGWAIDPDVAGPVDVHFYVNGSYLTAVTADETRTDVAAVYPSYGPNHGYDVTIPVGAAAGSVCVFAINAGAGPGNPLLGCRTFDHNPFGSFEQVRRVDAGRLRVSGWAIDPDTPDPVDVHVYVDGVFTGAATADDLRLDVAAVYPAYGADHGFDITFSAGAGARTVCVFAINASSGTGNPALGCRAAP
jgi:hypothetical protein